MMPKFQAKAVILAALILFCALALAAQDRQIVLSGGNDVSLRDNGELGFTVQ